MFNSDCNIILDSNITYISYGIAKAFENSKKVIIPNSVKEIGTNAFLAGFQNYYWMPFYHSLKEVYYKGNKNNTPWNWNDIGIDIKIVKEI